MTRRALWLLLGLAGLAIGGGAFLFGRPVATPQPPATAAGDAPVGIGALGRIEPASRVRRLAAVSAPEGSRISRLLVKEGDRVSDGQVLAEFHDLPKREAALEQAQANARLRQAQLDKLRAGGRDTDIAAARARIAALVAAEESARREADRAQRVLRSAAGSEAAWDRARFTAEQASAERARAEADLQTLLSPREEDVRIAEAELSAAEAAVATARADLALARMTAPIAGTVLRIIAREGEKVPSEGLMEIADLSALDVVAEIYETDLPRVRAGAPARIVVPGDTATYGATVREIGWLVRRNTVVDTDPVAAVDARVVEVRLTLDEAATAALMRRTNMQVQVSIAP
jgi:HlyD family secretion protein